jgi:hypothetical protein
MGPKAQLGQLTIRNPKEDHRPGQSVKHTNPLKRSGHMTHRITKPSPAKSNPWRPKFRKWRPTIREPIPPISGENRLCPFSINTHLPPGIPLTEIIVIEAFIQII